ncbi:hypothetical protein [Mycolicibacter virginiensis]|uniref:hypothetical protein n=1 Tax=Mycolicibacter virginiensis TaxID=1795032 RepID=UPI001F04ADA5|nr:hypothetical protein [Mycolicibacter virginiensis]ULP48058.1 hypothetical protein MJO54_02480 [Mycolicibacter virginiensis]
MQLLPAIEAAEPLRGTVETAKPLTGVDYALDAWTRLISDRATSVEWGLNSAGTDFRSRAVAVGGTVILEVECGNPAARELLAERLIEMAERRGNLGRYSYTPGSALGRFNLIREGVEDPTFGWCEQSKTYAFYRGGDYRRSIWDLAGLAQKADRGLQYPQPEFGSDDRGGIATLTLPPGMLPKQVQAAESALRQALAMPELAVTVDGIHPVIRLNQRPIVREFPKQNPLKAQWFTRPRTQAERHAAAADFVLPLGVREDGSPILINQDRTCHVGMFAESGAGKTVLLTSMVRAAVLQGAEVILLDAKSGKDLRKLALERLPGVVHYSAARGGNDAVLHRAVRYARDELERRQALSARLIQQGVEYRPTPLLIAFDEFPAWINDKTKSKVKEIRDGALETLANMSYIASQAREFRIFLLVAGQFAYRSAWDGELQANTSTLVLLGQPTEINRQNLFPPGATQQRIKELGDLISPKMKGRGIIADIRDDGPPQIAMFQGFFNPPGRDADAFDAAVRQAPRLRRFAWRFPLPGEKGGDGSWQKWTPATEPSSNSIPVQILDGTDGVRDPAAVIFDPTSEFYKPGAAPLSGAHQNAN